MINASLALNHNSDIHYKRGIPSDGVQPVSLIYNGDRISDIYYSGYWFSKRITPDMALPPKNANKPDHFPSTTITGLLVRMDAESAAAVTGYAGEPHVVMVYNCSVSV